MKKLMAFVFAVCLLFGFAFKPAVKIVGETYAYSNSVAINNNLQKYAKCDTKTQKYVSSMHKTAILGNKNEKQMCALDGENPFVLASKSFALSDKGDKSLQIKDTKNIGNKKGQKQGSGKKTQQTNNTKSGASGASGANKNNDALSLRRQYALSVGESLDKKDGDYFVVFAEDDLKKVVFVKGDEVCFGDEYISSDNKKYIVCEVDEKTKTAKARFVEDVKLPVINVKRNDKKLTSAEAKQVRPANANGGLICFAKTNKQVGLYHTHNDECYNDEDGKDSVYGKGGIHDIGKLFMGNLEQLGISVEYNEDLHLPHNSGAYTRSEVTVESLLSHGNKAAIFDLHRDATPRKEYLTKVNGETMSKVRMVVGAGNASSEQNKEFALAIKAYADEVYPGLIKDIYIGKGNYNQQHFARAMLFEMGTNTIEKEYVRRSTLPLAKTLDAVLFGVNNASEKTKEDATIVPSSSTAQNTSFLENGLASSNQSPASDKTLLIVLLSVGGVLVLFAVLYALVPKIRYSVNRFFAQIFPFGRKKS